MLMPSPIVVRSLLARYASLAGQDSAAARQELEQVSYTLCVTTATTTIEDALAAAEVLAEREVPTGRQEMSPAAA
ncbi:DUF5133 domain-containing protein [Streptomyces sp. NPDC053429]|uniref:DUF5133 domain-containing protein n=1 Tax=Streptomyces sp. NPDC053429 TaxID=3365702 RepID=UPI0037D01F08